jgi:cobalt-zinc-cadmium efflux system outer membrane protein
MNKLMGLWGADASFRVADRMPELPPAEAPLEHLESLAIAQRLDVAAAWQEVQTRGYALAMAKNWRWISGASVGAGIDRESDGPLSAGPQGSLEVPLFDQKQAVIAKLDAEYRRSERALAALAIDVRADVRELRAKVLTQRALVEYYRTSAIPLRERIVALSQQHYDAMLLGVYQLLQAKQAEANTYREYIEAVRDYWIARSDLSRACGGRIPGTQPSALVAPSPATGGP